MSTDALERLPNVRREFDLNRDPSIKAQLEAEKQTEAQRREDQGGKGASDRDQPKPELLPPPEMRKAMVGPMLSGNWMGQHKTQVFVRSPQHRSQAKEHAPQRAIPEPSR